MWERQFRRGEEGVGTPNTHEKTGVSFSMVTTERCRRLPDGSSIKNRFL